MFEIVLEPDVTGTVTIDAERAQLGYDLGDNMTLWLGRVHTPIGQWNQSFHHGGQLQNTVYRPRFIDFEDSGGIIPTHIVGLWLHGSNRVSSSGKIGYDLYAANNPRLIDAGVSGGPKPQGMLDFNLNRTDGIGGMLGINVNYEFTSGFAEGLKLGAHAYSSRVNDWSQGSSSYLDVANSTPTTSTQVGMYGGYAFYEGDFFDFDAEFYFFNDKDKTTSSSTSTWKDSMYFIEADVPVTNKLRPYVMYERVCLDATDQYFSAQFNAMSNSRENIGIRYDLTPKAALKFNYSHTKVDSVSPALANANYYNIGTPTLPYSFDIFAVQYAVRF